MTRYQIVMGEGNAIMIQPGTLLTPLSMTDKEQAIKVANAMAQATGLIIQVLEIRKVHQTLVVAQ